MRPFDGAIGNEDAILMVVSSGLADFIENAVESISRAKVAGADIVMAVAKAAEAEVAHAVRNHPDVMYFLIEPGNQDGGASYHDNGSDNFGVFTVEKWPAIIRLLKAGYKRVTCCDVDLVWRHDPLPLLRSALGFYDLAIQNDGLQIFPPACCTGFMTYRNSPFNIALLEALLAGHRSAVKEKPKLHDQDIFNMFLRQKPEVWGRIWALSELTFANGLLAPALAVKDEELLSLSRTRLNPLIFHANWSIGLEQKREMLKRTGNWFLGS